MKKKGFFFTFAAIFLVILIVALITSNERLRYTDKSKAISSRVATMDYFIEDFEKDLDREMYIGGYRALLSMHSYSKQLEDFVSDFNTIFGEIFVNGTAEGEVMPLMKEGSQGADLKSWLVRINEESSKLSIIVTAEINSIEVYHTSPWIVQVALDLAVNITDAKGLASWAFEKTYTKDFPILGFEDPLYTVSTNDKITNLINITPDIDFVNDSTSDASALETHLLNSYYINTTEAPSYLMRFTGNMSGSEFGIESMVNLVKLDTQGLPLQEKSLIDHIYFGNQTTTDCYNISGMPSWFRIDNSHLELYEVDKLNTTGC